MLAAPGCRCHHHRRSLRQQDNASATWKKTFGFHPLLVFFDRRDIGAGQALTGLLRKGNARANTTADRISVLVSRWRRPGQPECPEGFDPLGFGRRHPRVSGTCRTAGRVFPGGGDRRADPRRGSRCSKPPTAGIRRSIPAAPPAKAPGSPNPPNWWICRNGRPEPG